MAFFRDIIEGRVPYKLLDKRAMFCIDFENWRPYLDNRGIQIDWRAFHTLAHGMFRTVDLFYYEGMLTWSFFLHCNSNSPKPAYYRAKKRREQYQRELKSFGYTVRSKPIQRIHTGFHRDSRAETGQYKCNCDVEMTIDVMDNLRSYDVFVLCTGDGDFVPLAKRIKAELKEVWAVSIENRMNSHLREAVSRYLYLNNMIQFMPSLTRKK